MAVQLPIGKLAMPPGSLILITGVNGYLGSHLADQLLARGFRVRGTVRNLDKTSWMKGFFRKRHPKSAFELCHVPDISIEGCFDDAVKGASGAVHVATVMGSADEHKVISHTVASGLNIVRAAAREPSVERVVYTSSGIAAAMCRPDVACDIHKGSWNTECFDLVRNLPHDDIGRGLAVYAASKTQTELEMFRWVMENKPKFVLNSVLPAANFGSVLDPSNQGFPSTAGIIKDVMAGNTAQALFFGPQYHVHPLDTAHLHLAALLHPTTASARLFAFATPFTWPAVLSAISSQHANAAAGVEITDDRRCLIRVSNERALKLLRWVRGDGEGEGERRGWIELERGVLEVAGQVREFGGV